MFRNNQIELSAVVIREEPKDEFIEGRLMEGILAGAKVQSFGLDELDALTDAIQNLGRDDLFVWCLSSVQAIQLVRILTIDRAWVDYENRQFSAKQTIRDFYGILAALKSHADSDRSSLIVAPVPDKKLEDALCDWQVKIVDPGELSLGTLLLLDRHGKHRFDPEEPISKEDKSEKWGPWGFRQSKGFARRLRQEFDQADVRSRFQQLCERVFPRPKDVLIAQEHLFALHVLRLCRRIVNWTLEGSPFECSVLLMNHSEYLRANRFVSPLVEFNKKVPFHFENLDEIRNLGEMTQSYGLLFYVSTDDMNAHNITVIHPAFQAKTETGKTRQELFK